MNRIEPISAIKDRQADIANGGFERQTIVFLCARLMRKIEEVVSKRLLHPLFQLIFALLS